VRVLRLFVALVVGKLVVHLSRLSGRGGTTLPGRVARIIEPSILRRLARQCGAGRVVVSGTNGKTTTTSMLAAVLRAAGQDPVHNRTGANLISGVTASFLGRADLRGRVRAPWSLSEVDEATMPAAVSELQPRAALVTNVFRDQLDRYGEVEHTAALIRRGLERLPADALALLNADDPLVAWLGEGLKARVLYYGLEVDGRAAAAAYQPADVRNCLRCGAPYQYDVHYYAHLGRYRCPSCGWGRPAPDVAVTGLKRGGTQGSLLQVTSPFGTASLRLGLPGLYNVYNALAAAAATLALGFSPETVAAGLGDYATAFGRMETMHIEGRHVFMALIKNPAGCNEVLYTLLEDEGPKPLVIAINDNFADGVDVSWLWDADFEALAAAQGDIPFAVTSGLRAEDMAVRLKYAGFDPRRVSVERDLGGALKAALSRVPAGGTLYVLPTYTAMLEMRETVGRRGLVHHFWEDPGRARPGPGAGAGPGANACAGVGGGCAAPGGGGRGCA